jgi:glycogen operon protein
MRNLMATLFLSQGVPMLQAGDEFARTQAGNNNAYCQDNEISWIDWHLRTVNHDLLKFVQLLAHLRRQHGEFRRDTFLKGTALRAGSKDVSWLNMNGTEMTQADWQEADLHGLAVWFGKAGRPSGKLLLLLNAGATERLFPLPPAGEPWICLFDTSHETLDVTSLGSVQHYPLGSRSVVLLEC